VSYSLGRGDDHPRPQSNGSANRSIHPLPERDGRSGTAGLATGSAGGTGPNAGRGGNDNYGVHNERQKEDSAGIAADSANGAAGGGAGNFLNGGGQRDNLPSLPSLKASGLLDSWNAPPSRDMKTQSHGNKGPTQRTSPRRTTPPMLPPPPVVANDSDVRSTASLGMPIGLPWLANDLR